MSGECEVCGNHTMECICRQRGGINDLLLNDGADALAQNFKNEKLEAIRMLKIEIEKTQRKLERYRLLDKILSFTVKNVDEN